MCGSFMDAMAGFVRCLFGAICCFLCVGPALVIIGAVLVTKHNSRDDDVANYNHAVDAYNALDAPVFAQTVMSISSVTMSRQNVPVDVKGDTSGVNAASHYIFSLGTVPLMGDDYTIDVANVAVGSAQQSINFNIPMTATVDRTLNCDLPRCTDKCTDSSFICAESTMRAFCTMSYNGTYTSTTPGICYNDQPCGNCHYTGNLNHACVVVSVTNLTSIAASQTVRSCYYPFQDHDYLPGVTEALIEVMSERDPFIALERITSGGEDFGDTASTQRSTGVSMLIIGVIITLVISCIAIWLIRRQQRQHERRIIAAGPAANYGPPTAQEPYSHDGKPFGQEYFSESPSSPAQPSRPKVTYADQQNVVSPVAAPSPSCSRVVVVDAASANSSPMAGTRRNRRRFADRVSQQAAYLASPTASASPSLEATVVEMPPVPPSPSGLKMGMSGPV